LVRRLHCAVNPPTIASGDDADRGLLLVVGLVVGEPSAWALRQRDEAVRAGLTWLASTRPRS
jgi:hypothetical protein